jgi:hypothetical protein
MGYQGPRGTAAHRAGRPGARGEEQFTPAHPTHMCEGGPSGSRAGDGLSQVVASPQGDTRHADAQGLTSGGGHLDRGGLRRPRKWGIPGRKPRGNGLGWFQDRNQGIPP